MNSGFLHDFVKDRFDSDVCVCGRPRRCEAHGLEPVSTIDRDHGVLADYPDPMSPFEGSVKTRTHTLLVGVFLGMVLGGAVGLLMGMRLWGGA